MARFTVRGEVPPFGRGWNVRVQNVDEPRRFWRDERIDTDLDWNPREVWVTIGARDLVAACEAGDVVDYALEAFDRADGRRIRGVEPRVVTPANRADASS